MYNFDDVMSRLSDIEEKIDFLIEKTHEYEELSSYQNENRYALVTRRQDGIYCVHKFVDKVLTEIAAMGIHNETYAENAAENWVLSVNS
jgi:uncharacterized protein YqeY